MFDILVINALLVTVVVVIHFEALKWISDLLPRLPNKPRIKVLFGVFAAMAAHVVEVWALAISSRLARSVTWQAWSPW